MTRRLILSRHGQTDYNAPRRMQGQLDTHLSDLGREQAARAGQALIDEPITRIISSDLSRAFDTATIIAGQLGLDVEKDERLRETHLGEWQSRTSVEVDEELPGARAAWRHDATWPRRVVSPACRSPAAPAPSSMNSWPTTTTGMATPCSSSPMAARSPR